MSDSHTNNAARVLVGKTVERVLSHTGVREQRPLPRGTVIDVFVDAEGWTLLVQITEVEPTYMSNDGMLARWDADRCRVVTEAT